jgi:hypothetical protein
MYFRCPFREKDVIIYKFNLQIIHLYILNMPSESLNWKLNMLSCTGNFKSKNKLMISKIHFIKRPMDVTNLNVILNVTVIWKYLESLTTENIYK